jgi:hypothetical protein
MGNTVRFTLQYLFYNVPTLVGLLLLCGVMGLVLSGFTIYHLSLAASNVTTNESFKWRELQTRVDYITQRNEVSGIGRLCSLGFA